MGVLPPDFARMVTGCAGCRRGALRAWLGLCSVWVAIYAAIERTGVVHAGPTSRHWWAVTTLGGVGGGRVAACRRVVGVVAGLSDEGVWPLMIVGGRSSWTVAQNDSPVPSCQ